MKILEIRASTQFKKDLKKIKKQNKDLMLLKTIVNAIVNRLAIDEKHKNHKLLGDYCGYAELHIQPDWLLIYQINKDELYLFRTGSHSELF